MSKIAFTSYTADNPMGKMIKADGSKVQYGFDFVQKAARQNMTLADLANRFKASHFLTAGCYPSQKPVRIVPKNAERHDKDTYSRTKEECTYVAGPSLMVIDNDFAEETGATLAILSVIAPELLECGYISKGSSGSYIAKGDETIRGCKGEHVMFGVTDGTDIPRALEMLHVRAILGGFDKSYVGKAGQLLIRSPIDMAVAQAHQPVFLAAHLDSGLEQDLHVEHHGGPLLDTKALIPDLTPEERAAFEEHKLGLKKRFRKDIREAKDECVKERVADGWDEATARAAVNGGRLSSEAVILIADGTKVTVADILTKPDTHNLKLCLDPLEPGYRGGAVVGIIYAHDGVIYSQAHGGKTYKLRFEADVDFADDLDEDDKATDQAIGEGTKEYMVTTTRNSNLSLRQMQERFVFVEGEDSVCDRERPSVVMTLTSFNNAFLSSRTWVETQNGGKFVQTTKLWLSGSPDCVRAVTWAPGKPMITLGPDGRVAFNTHNEFVWPTFKYDQGAVDKFVAHIKWLFNGETEPFLDWFAHIEQFPFDRPSTAYLHIAPFTGLGRNWVSSLAVRLWPGEVAGSFDLDSYLDGGFTGRLGHKRLIVVDEMRNTGKDKHQRAQRFKTAITEDTRTINPKYGRETIEYNCARWLVFSNHISAMPLDGNDRRVNVSVCDDRAKVPSYYTDLYNSLKDVEFVLSVKQFLRERDLSKFNPGAPAKLTEAKEQMIDSGKSNTQVGVEEFLEEATGVVLMDDILSHLGMRNASTTEKQYAGRAAAHALEDAGWRKLKRVKVSGKLQTAYCHAEHFAAFSSMTSLQQHIYKPPCTDFADFG